MTSVSPDNFSTADTYVGRSAPWSQEAEQAVLGAMLLDQDAALRAAELVDDSMFYREAHRRGLARFLATGAITAAAVILLAENRIGITQRIVRHELGADP